MIDVQQGLLTSTIERPLVRRPLTVMKWANE
jgi:hypothetical protein